MLLFAYYLLKVILVSGLLYGWYLIALRNKKFHQYNRVYLLMTVLLSLILPLIKVEFQTSRLANAIQYISVLSDVEIYVKNAATKSTFSSDYNILVFSGYLVISSVAFLILVIQLLKISLLIKNSPKSLINDIYLVFARKQKAPFSFFNYIFWDKAIDINSEEGNCVLQHELTHVRQKHSFDKLFCNILLIAGWANPFFWIIRKELNMVHEFIADESAVLNNDQGTFATMLLTAAYPQHTSFLVNSFFHSPIKRRLIMITTSKATRFGFFRRAMIIPLLALVSVLFAFRIAEKNGKLSQSFSENKADESVSDTLKQSATFAGGVEAWKKYLETNLNAGVVDADKAPKGIYTVKIQFVVTEDGVVKDVLATQVPKACPHCGIEAARIIKNSPNWDPAIQNDGRKVLSQNIQFISFLKQ